MEKESILSDLNSYSGGSEIGLEDVYSRSETLLDNGALSLALEDLRHNEGVLYSSIGKSLTEDSLPQFHFYFQISEKHYWLYNQVPLYLLAILIIYKNIHLICCQKMSFKFAP